MTGLFTVGLKGPSTGLFKVGLKGPLTGRFTVGLKGPLILYLSKSDVKMETFKLSEEESDQESKSSQDQFWLQNIQSVNRIFVGKIGLWNFWLDKIVLNCPKGRKET